MYITEENFNAVDTAIENAVTTVFDYGIDSEKLLLGTQDLGDGRVLQIQVIVTTQEEDFIDPN